MWCEGWFLLLLQTTPSWRELWPAVFRPKCIDLHLTTCSAHSRFTKQLLCLRALLWLPLPFSNRCVIYGFNSQTVYTFFLFIGKDTKQLSVKNQPYATPWKIQSINDESPFTTVFVDPSVQWLKGLNSSRVGGSGCSRCSGTTAGCQFSCLFLALSSCLLPAVLLNLLLLAAGA